ncbi:MAG: DNA polymerase III subunit beta [Clostridia bacterium]|nr:DNA polymerase III subunit beta [Clostridia bacterium]
MKIIFDRSKMASALTPLMATVGSRSTLPAIEGILIEAKAPDSLTLTTYDIEKGMRTTIEAEVLEDGYFIVNAQKLNKALYVMESDKIVFTVDEKFRATLKSGKAVISMNALDGEDFPSVPSLKSEMGFYISQKLLRRMLQKIGHAMAQTSERQVLNGCFVHVEDDSIVIVSCNGHKLATCKTKTSIKKGNEKDSYISYSFILPYKTVGELLKLLSDDEEAITRIFLMRKHIVFEIGNIVFFSRLIEGEYVDYERLIITSHKINVDIDKEELMAALERAALITEEKIAGRLSAYVKLTLEDEYLEISAASVNGSSHDEMKVVHDGEDIVIAFNNRYLIDSLRSCDSEKVRFSMSSPLTGMNVTPVNEDGDTTEELYMIQPIRMND